MSYKAVFRWNHYDYYLLSMNTVIKTERGASMAKLKGQELINDITKEYMKTDLPEFRAGDTVKVSVKIKDVNGKERIQVFEGLVIKKQGGGISETYTVRKISYGVGVERTFPMHSPQVAKLEVVRHGIVRRAKLNYIRTLSAKAARIKERRV